MNLFNLDFGAYSFARPGLLFVLLVPALLAVWEIGRQGVRIPIPFDFQPSRATRPWRRRLLGGLVVMANLLPAIVAGAAIIALAGPRISVQGERQKQLTNIQICLDISGSMGVTYGDATRYDAAMEAVANFTDAREGDAFGLTVFGNDVLHWVPLTTDTDALRRATPFVRPGLMPAQFGGTSIALGLRECLGLLARRAEGERMIILISDGQSADIQGNLAAEVGQELREGGVVVYPIHIADSAVPEPLYTIAGITGGETFSAGDPAALAAVFARIDAMQPVELTPPGRAFEERLKWPATVAFIAAGLHGLSLLGLRFTPW